ncbi:hypothetical protein RKD49_002116 [Streptomyces glaucescens]
MNALTLLLYVLSIPVGFAVGVLLVEILWRLTH